jgi:hypothetical protein
MARGCGVGQFPVTGGEWGWGKRPRCMPEAWALILGDGEGETHQRTHSMAAGGRPVKLDGGRPEERWREAFVRPGSSSAPM